VKDKKLTRRDFLRMSVLTATGAALAACAPKVVKETVVVEKPVEKIVKETVMIEGTPQVVEKVVTATPLPKAPVPIHYTTQELIQTYDPLLYELVKDRGLNVDLSMDYTPMEGGWEGYADSLVIRIAGGEALDVVHMAIQGTAMLASKNIIRSLDPFLEADTEFKKDIDEDIHPVLLKMLQYEGKQVELPTDWNNMIMYYNYKIFEEKGVPEPTPDWTWDDFLAACIAIADVTGGEDDLYAYSFYDWSFAMAVWYFNNDTSVLTDDWADSNYDDPKVAETLQFLADLIFKYKVTPSPFGWDEWGNFHSGHLAMRTCGGWCLYGAKAAEFEDYKFQYMPHNAGPLKTVIGSGGDGITTVCPHPDEAWEVLKLINGPECQMSHFQTVGSIQSRRSVVNTEEFRNGALPAPADMSIFYESLDYAATDPSPVNQPVIYPLIQRWTGQIWSGDLTVEEAVKGCHQELQAEMDLLKA